MLLRTAVVIFVLLGLQACKHDPQDQPQPELSFSADVKPIINSNCSMAGCHAGLSDYSQLMAFGEIKPGDASDSELYEKITETRSSERMPPPPNAPLTQDQINTIKTWIDQGAKNN